ncbi:hypothetical protein SD70_01015 [Gordoniibacillus kamchatkensis]|uniref:ABC transporter substrate-binding protein n=1 Tax=Gordoniibacillus kamchatkensis TaxID=1590651 RepID=A0ABR5ANF2_9BACL|nr:ABC transporter substrate-binding protein [Paenibacillus sp. VKM B-2647]KIL42502.1 hypothetical protein SD70_01015 [Paenibacillus sp. VKM B-2647]
MKRSLELSKMTVGLISTTLLLVPLIGCQTSNNASQSKGASGAQEQNVSKDASKKQENPGNIDFTKASGSIVWGAYPIAHGNERQELIDKFQEKYPNIKVTLQELPSNTDTMRQLLTTQIGGGSETPDVYLGDVIWPAQFAEAQLAMPLDKYLPKSFFDRFATGLVDGASYKGNIYAAPFFVDSGLLYYRKDLLEKEGLQPPKTWEEVQKYGQLLQQKGDVKFGFVWQGASYEGLTCDFMEYLTSAGGKVMSADGKPTFDSPESRKAIHFMKGLIDSGVSPKSVVTFHENEAMDAFNAGAAAFLRNWDYAWFSANDPRSSKVVDKVGVMTLPKFEGGEKGFATIGGYNLQVNPHTKNLAASLAFIDFLTGEEAQSLLATKYSIVPTNKAVQNNPDVKKVSPVTNIVSEVNFISRPAKTSQYAQVSSAIYTNLNKILTGGADVEGAIKDTQKQIESAVSGGSGL